MITIDGKVAIVTGGAKGLGRATAERLIQAGSSGVVVADVCAEEVRKAAGEITNTYGVEVLPCCTDVSDQTQVEAMAKAALDKFGRIDILVNNASICPVVSWEDATLENWNKILSVNLTGMYLCTRAVIPHLKSRGNGRIVYVSSPSAYIGSVVAHVAYGVSKAGIIALMKFVAKNFAGDGILANAILPGPMDTPMGHSFGEELWKAWEQKAPLKRHASASEIADSILFLVSDQSSYITGHVLWVDGGYSLT